MHIKTQISLLLIQVSVLVLLPLPGNIHALEFDFSGQFTSWILENRKEGHWENHSGFRYIPQLRVRQPTGDDALLDLELSANAFITTGEKAVDEHYDVDRYRMWLRYSTSQLEVRLGLQKINFGSATLLRPLMWFDRIDPRDPLQLTEGVYGLLTRYYFLNNANIWLWGLLGNDETKGWETLPSDEGRPEFGGRVQVPFFDGELAFSFHNREADLTRAGNETLLSFNGSAEENRLGVDGKWDVGIGVWFEAVLNHHDVSPSQFRYQRLMTVGMDYTFDVGNGLYVLGEQFFFAQAEKALSWGQGVPFSALSANYPLGVIDKVSGILYYDWEHEDWFRYVQWQRTYDTWFLFVSGFWNPDQFQFFQNTPQRHQFAGKGFQVMIVLNH